MPGIPISQSHNSMCSSSIPNNLTKRGYVLLMFKNRNEAIMEFIFFREFLYTRDCRFAHSSGVSPSLMAKSYKLDNISSELDNKICYDTLTIEYFRARRLIMARRNRRSQKNPKASKRQNNIKIQKYVTTNDIKSKTVFQNPVPMLPVFEGLCEASYRSKHPARGYRGLHQSLSFILWRRI